MITQIAFPKEKIADFCRRHHIRRLAVFGSAIRDDFREDSDLDILVEFEPQHTPGLAFFTMERELSEILRQKVDPNTVKFLSEHYRKQVAKEALPLYEQT